MEGNPVHYNNVHGLITALNIIHNSEGWRLLTNSSKLNLKAVLLHNGQVLLAIRLNHMTTWIFF